MDLRRALPSALLPRPASSPVLAPMSCRHHSSDERHDELLDVTYIRPERNRLDIEFVLRVERGPLELLRFVLKNSAVNAIGGAEERRVLRRSNVRTNRDRLLVVP